MSNKSIEKIICEGDVDYTIKTPEEFQEMGCKEKAFSPINISYDNACKISLPELKWENWSKKPLKMEILNTGDTVLVAGLWRKDKPMISGGPLASKYRFLQLHFHWGNRNEEGSFHTFDNEAIPLEMHAIFVKECYKTQEEALPHSDGLIVLVYVYKVDNSENQSIEVISQLCPLLQQSGNSMFCPPMEIGSFLYPFSNDYFVYWGSIKVEQIGHPMLWLLCRQPFAITSEQMQRFRSLMKTSDRQRRNHCPVKLPDNGENDLFLVNPTSTLQSTLQSTLLTVDPRLKWENIKNELAISKKKDVEHKRKNLKGFESGDDSRDNDECNEFNINLVAKAVRAVKSFMENSASEEVVKTCSKSLNDITASFKQIDELKQRYNREELAMLTGKSTVVAETKSTIQCSSPGNVAECAQMIADACEYQAEQRDRGQDGGSEANCSRSKIQFAVDQEDEVSGEIQIEPAASSEPESEVQVVCPKAGLLSVQDSVQYLRHNYRKKNKNTTDNSSSITQKATENVTPPQKQEAKPKNNQQVIKKQTAIKISSIPLKINSNKSILKSNIPTKINKRNSIIIKKPEQRSSTAPGIFSGNRKKPIFPPANCRPTTARERTKSEKISLVQRPVTASKEPDRPTLITKINKEVKPRWKY